MTGARVGGGRLRVDAARAVDKLRDYQLADPVLWVLEVIRAAVLAGATRIDVYGDTDDVVVSWEGPPLAPDEPTRLFEELVDPAPAAARRHLRLLATGVNSALGTEPRWVDVVRCDGTGELSAVRYAPRLLERRGDVAEGLRSLAVEPRAPSPRAPARGGMVHLRRFPLLSAMPVLVGIGGPPELGAVRRACDDLSVPLTINGRSQLGRERSHEDLLRLELGEGLEGFLALIDPTFAEDEGRLEVAELGVQLARYALPWQGQAERRDKVPLRLYVDAPRMPTNASRSAVRIEEPPVSDALARAKKLLPELVARLVRELGDAPEHPWSPTQRERLRAAALALLAAAVAGERWRERVCALATQGDYGVAVAPLTDVPLLRDALGRRRSAASFARRTGADVAWYALDPVPEALAPWLGEVLWVPPGDPAARLFGGTPPPSAKALVQRARRADVARARWLREPTRPASIPPSRGHLVSVPLKPPHAALRSVVPKDAFAVPGIAGEVVLLDPRVGGTSRVSLCVEGRELESVPLDLPVPVVAVAHAPSLRASPDYRGVERDEAFDAVLRAVRAAVVVACEALAWHRLGKPRRARATLRADWVARPDGPQGEALCALVRGGLAVAIDLVPPARVVASTTPLLDASIVRTRGGPSRSLRALIDQARDGVVPWIALDAAGVFPGPGRVQEIESWEVAIYERLLGSLALVDYGRAVGLPVVDVFALSVPAGSAALRIDESHRRAHVAWTEREAAIDLLHVGRRLSSRPSRGTVSRCHVAVDDARLVPDPSFRALRSGDHDYPVAAWERSLAAAYVDALTGAPPANLALEASAPAQAHVAWRALVAMLEAVEPLELLGRERLARLRAAPLVAVQGEHERVSLDELERRHGEGALLFIQPTAITVSSTLELGDFHPARLTTEEARAFARVLRRPFEEAGDELERRVTRARRAEALARHRRTSPPPLPEWTAEGLCLEGRGFRRAYVAFAPFSAQSSIEVWVEGRPFARRFAEGPPLRVCLLFDEDALDERFAALGPNAERAVGHVSKRGARELLADLASRTPSALVEWPPARALAAAWAESRRQAKADRQLAARLAAVPAFRSLQGEPLSVEEASTEQGALRIARWDEPWLGSVESRASVYDHGVIRLPTDEDEAAALRVILDALARGGTRDVTGSVARLQAERRIERGLVRAPRLPAVVDTRFRYDLADLLADDPETAEVLGLGEAAFARGSRAKLYLFHAGAQHEVVELDLVPPVAVAAESPLAPRGAPRSPRVRERLEAAMRAVTALVMRRVVDGTPGPQLPPWVRRELRASLLVGGTDTHFDRLADTPLFETTSGAWVSPAALRAQRERFGALWWVPPSAVGEPLDEQRVALRLEPEEARRLGGMLELVEASRELELDRRARVNLQRPPVPSLEPTEAERGHALSILRLEPELDEASHGVVLLLRPGRGARALHLHRELRGLGATTDPAHWPSLARMEDPSLTPNRVWDGVESTAALSRLRQRVRAAVDAELLRLLPTPSRKLACLRARAVPRELLGLSEGVVLEGVVWLEHERPTAEPGRLALVDARGERELSPTREGRPLPIFGTLWLSSGSFGTELGPRLASVLYGRMIEKLASWVGEAESSSLELAHLIHAVSDRALAPSAVEGPLPCFGERAITLEELSERARGGGRVVLARSDEEESVRAAQLEGEPVLYDDGSPVAEALRNALEGTLVPFRDALRARVFDERSEPLAAPRRATVLEVGGAAERPLSSEERLQRLLAEGARDAGLGQVQRVTLLGRARPLVAFEGSALLVAAQHPSVVSLAGALASASPSASSMLALLLARAVGELRRADEVGVETEHAVLRALLERR